MPRSDPFGDSPSLGAARTPLGGAHGWNEWKITSNGPTVKELIVPQSMVGKILAVGAVAAPLLKVAPWPVALGAWTITRLFKSLR